MIKKVARLAFLKSGDKKESLITSRRQTEGGGDPKPGLMLCGCMTIRYLKMHEL